MTLHVRTGGIPSWSNLLGAFFAKANKFKLLFFFILFGMKVSATTFFVKPIASGNGTGTSWTNASADLQAIINGAASGDEVWVAAGTYIPTRDYSGSASPGDLRTKAFTLKEGVKLYGGFNGTETLLSQQNTTTNITILSGDIGVVNVNTDNCYHVVLGINLTNITVFNGFTLRDGYANGGSANYGGNIIYHTFGGGLLNAKCTYTVSNIVFLNNYGNEGAALVNTQAEGLNPVPTVTINDCKFISNTSLNNSGAVYTHASICNINRSVFNSNTGGGICAFPFGNFVIDRCVFVSNTSTHGGAARMRKGNLTVKNSVFANNSASQYGGAVFIVNENNESSSNIYNCTFYGNSAIIGGNAFWGPGSILYNCIFSNNTGTAYTIDGNNASSVEYSVIEASQINNAATNSLRVATPAFVNTADLDGADNIWGTLDDGLMIGLGSTAFNAGGSLYAQTIDMVGTSRPQFGIVDIGAYESTIDYTPPAIPTITSFTTNSGTVGTSITITGTNFNTTAANNIVYFGAVRSATPSSATVTSLTVTVPLGAAYGSITVLNTVTGLQAQSKTYFNPTHSATKATIVEADFVKTNVSSGTPNIWSMPCERADLDLDGDIDLIMNNYNSTTAGLLVFPNTSTVGSISVGSSIGYPVLAPVRGLVTADLDGDGKQDIIGVGDYTSVSIWRNTSAGSISFASRVDLSMTHTGNDVAIGDIDGDGKIDLVVTNNYGSNVSVFLNNSTIGTLSFAPRVDLPAVANVYGVKIGDINGDGKNDIVTTNVTAGSCISIFRNTGTATGTVSFATRSDFSNGTISSRWVELGDIDMDGNLDLIVSNSEWIVSVFRNTSSGNTMSLATPVSSNYGWVVDRVNIGDLNGDSKPDIIIPRGGMVAILTNNSTSGNIALTGQFDMGASGGGGMQSIEVVDLDLDGKLDMFNGGDNTKIDFYRYSPPPPPPPTITNFTPKSGSVGTTVTITGTNFNTTAANNIVFFGATKATVTAATATSMTVTVPAGATFDNITEVNMGISLLAHSNANFTPTFTPNKNSIAPTDFDPKIEIATGSGTTWPYQVALGDIDGDGKADLVVANRAANNVSVFRNTSISGTVSFATRLDFSTAQEPRGLALVDLDGDGKLDIATTGGNLNQIAFTVLRNASTNGNVSFETKIETNTTAATYSIASADIDGDGKEDLIFGGSKMIIFPNISTVGSITFGTPIDFTAAVNVNAIAIADIDGDAKKDICITAGSTVSVFRNTSTVGAISLATKVDFAAPQAYGITIGDWDGDNKLDIAASLLNTTNTLSIFTNTSTVGNIGFATRIDNNSPQNPYFVAGGDLNGDGKVDLVTTNAGQNGTAANLSVYRNTSTTGVASFASNVDLALGSWPYYAAIGDIDGDGKPDIVSSSVEANKIAIFRNNPQFQTINSSGTLTAFSSCTGSVSANQSFTVGGTALTANLVVTAPTGYEVSTTISSGYGSSVTLTPTSGTVASTTIYVRLASTATGSSAENITLASTGATTQSVAVTGIVNILPIATITASGSTTFCQGDAVTLNAPATTSTGGNAINLTSNGGRYVTVPHSNSVNLGAGTAYTIEAWINITDATNNTIVDKGDYNFLFQTHSNGNQGLGLYNRSFGWIYSAGTIPTNQWVHVAVTYNNKVVTFYKDGVVQGTYTASTNGTGDTGPLNIGRQQPGSCNCNIFDGSMDELRLWNVERTQAEIQASINVTIPTNSTGLVAYYKFDEGTGTTVADATTNGNNGTTVNNPTWMVPSTSPLGGTSGPTINYVWSPGGATTSLITATTSGSYTVTANSSNGCSATSAATVVTVNSLPTATITAGSATTFCAGGSVILTASTGTSYLWSNGATTQSTTITAGGSYTVTVANASNCSATSSATIVTVNTLPTVTITASGATTFCIGGSVTLIASSGLSYLWSNGATSQSITVNSGGSYSVAVANAGSCSATSSATVVSVNPLPIASISSASTFLCGSGATVSLTATGGTSYQWSNNGVPIVGATASTYSANTIGTYTATATSSFGCIASATGSIMLTQMATPILAYSYDSYCVNKAVAFTNQSTAVGSGAVTYTWSDNASNIASTTNANFTYATAGSYSVKLKAQSNSCANLKDSITKVISIENPVSAVRYNTVDVAVNDNIQLQSRNFGNKYTWSPTTGLNNIFISNPNATLSQQQEYLVTIGVPSGCSTKDTILVRVQTGNTIYVPNVFTPNGDGKNDKVIIIPVGISQLKVFRIYNRWNKKVFETSDINNGWDGKVNGVLQPLDTYVWVVEAITKDGTLIAKTGSITLLR